MRVLYFSPRICWPIISGAHLRDFYFARQLARNAQLTYIGLVNDDAGEAQASLLRQQLGNNAQVLALRREAGYGKANIVRGLVGPTPLNVLNFTSTRVLAEVDRLLREQTFDTIQIESMHLIAYARRARQNAPQARVILDWHNIESEILARYAENDSNPLRAWYAQRTSTLSRKVEDELLRLCHAHTVCSEREREVLLQRVPGARIEVVGNGVDCEFFAANPAADAARRDVLFMGRMDYHANVDAALYFVKQHLAADSRSPAGIAAGDRGCATREGNPGAARARYHRHWDRGRCSPVLPERADLGGAAASWRGNAAEGAGGDGRGHAGDLDHARR